MSKTDDQPEAECPHEMRGYTEFVCGGFSPWVTFTCLDCGVALGEDE